MQIIPNIFIFLHVSSVRHGGIGANLIWKNIINTYDTKAITAPMHTATQNRFAKLQKYSHVGNTHEYIFTNCILISENIYELLHKIYQEFPNLHRVPSISPYYSSMGVWPELLIHLLGVNPVSRANTRAKT